ncbi:pentapeptide repeat-containing protein [Pseudanabaena yagii]|uniref:NACHT domain-containing protein n=1 Tax=Pseudanabaena yagii GIHE-NHR1 TaxID=2722753 RepID=A0ABX1M0D0_9CYAN|nr:pentapeptide repeat-containing protein [Pseudanabaena yagii]NMF60479.1 NACHT domain-containing protein [Pseudanabaena yagii GIHE-NHR1]
MSKGVWERLWDLMNTKISISELTQGSVDTTKTFLDLSKALNENKSLPELTPLISQVSSLLDVLNLPIVQVVGAGLPFVSIASKLLQFYLNSTKEDPSLEDCVELVGQAAYLESFKKFFSDDDANKHLLEKLNEAKASDRLQKQIAQFSKSLTLTESDARTVLLCFHDSKLADGLTPIVLARLVEAGIEEGQAKIIVERISRMTHRDIKPALAEIKDKVKKLSVIYGSEWQREIETYDSIDRYLKEVIAEKPKEKVFEENFGFEDIYVELQVEAIAKNNNNSEPQFIEEWALGLLNDESKSGQVLFIQGEPGRGKSVFCRMFADRVRRELYPIWIPILIRLRDIDISAYDFDILLRNSVNTDFARSDNGWLTDRNTRFLFILDGFDELLLQRGRDRSLKDFLERVSSFQDGCKNIKERGHRIVITGRPLALFGIEREMRPNLERVKILDMSPEVQTSWLKKWAVLKGEYAAQKFQDFISDDQCPEQVKTLAKEPLLLYLLAAMHGDNRFKIEDFQKAGNSAKILIYDATLDWVLTKQRNDKLNPRLTSLDVEDIRDILKEAGLCVAQSGGECASLEVIEARLAPELKNALEDARKDQDKDTLPVALATFYLKAADGKNNSMEFLHKSFGEFLCAERLVDSLLAWSRQKPDPRRASRQVLEVEDKDLEWQVYDLLGFGALTSEIVEYLVALIEREFKGKDDDFARLFERLYGFYWAWSDGDFIEAVESDGEPMPLRKARLMQKQGVAIGQRKVDVYTGLNVLILMFTFHRYAQANSELKDKVSFHPCNYSSKDDAIDHPRQLLRIIGYGQCIEDGGFIEIVGKFLNNANLSEATLWNADLTGADLMQANLMQANLLQAELHSVNLMQANLMQANFIQANLFNVNLMQANLCEANLCEANLMQANLSDADLSYADLSDADLSYADLSYADLSDANLRDADLSDANLSDANLSKANLSKANLNKANLSGANLSGADLSDVNLSDINLSNANLSGTDLSYVNLSGADLSYANLSGADFSKADLSGANLSKANLSDANLSAYLSGANLSDANLSDANLSNADLSNANLSNADLSGANLNDAILIGANLHDAILSGAILSGAILSGAILYRANLSYISSNEGAIWSSARGLNKAINVPDALVSNPQFRAAVLLGNGSDLVVSGNVDGAIAAYSEAQTIDPKLEISAFYWNRLGWFGSLHNRATDVLFACEKAVELEKSAKHHNTRGLARALTGNLTGAIEDFEAAINSGELEGEMLEKRQHWLEALKSGINPFTPEKLEALRASEEATS